MPFTTSLAARSRLLSAKTIWGDLPPNSRTTGFTCSADARITARPVSTDPVKVIEPNIGCSLRALPASAPNPVTTLYTPAGKSRASNTSANRRAVRGVCSAGLITAVLPAERRGQAPADHAEGRVLGNDIGGNSYRLANRVVQVIGTQRDGLTMDLVRDAGVVVEVADAAGDLTSCMPEWLARVQRLQPRELLQSRLQ